MEPGPIFQWIFTAPLVLSLEIGIVLQINASEISPLYSCLCKTFCVCWEGTFPLPVFPFCHLANLLQGHNHNPLLTSTMFFFHPHSQSFWSKSDLDCELPFSQGFSTHLSKWIISISNELIFCLRWLPHGSRKFSIKRPAYPNCFAMYGNISLL